LLSDQRIGALSGLKSLKTLDLRANPLTDRSVETLAEFKNLRILDLTDTMVTDGGLAKLRGNSAVLSVWPSQATYSAGAFLVPTHALCNTLLYKLDPANPQIHLW